MTQNICLSTPRGQRAQAEQNRLNNPREPPQITFETHRIEQNSARYASLGISAVTFVKLSKDHSEVALIGSCINREFTDDPYAAVAHGGSGQAITRYVEINSTVYEVITVASYRARLYVLRVNGTGGWLAPAVTNVQSLAVDSAVYALEAGVGSTAGQRTLVVGLPADGSCTAGGTVTTCGNSG